jgi:hypothetical protein
MNMTLTEKQELARLLNDPRDLRSREVIWEVEDKVLTSGLYGLDTREMFILSWILYHRNVMLTTHLRVMAAFGDSEVEDSCDGAEEPLVDGSSPFN